MSFPVGRPPPETIEASGNIIEFFLHWARAAPDRPAIVFPRASRDGRICYQKVTYRDLDDDSARLASGLSRLGIRPGDRVFVLVPMSRALYTLMIALFRMGATVLFVDPWVGMETTAAICERLRPRALVGVPLAHLLRLKYRAIREIPISIVARGRLPFATARLETLVRKGSPGFQTVRRASEDTALITFTTGSSGRPKGANRTHGFLNAQGVALARHLTREPGDVDMPALPIFVLNNLGEGVPSVLPLMDFRRPADVAPGTILREIEDWRVTTIGGSPAYLAPIAAETIARKAPLERVRGIVTGGGPVPASLLRDLASAFPRAHTTILYGSTEAEPVAEIDAAEVLAETAALTAEGRGNCVGAPSPLCDVKVIAPTAGPIVLDARGFAPIERPEGQVGEVIVAGAHVQRDYVDDPEAVRRNKIIGPDGRVWHRLGDLAYRDGRGRIWLVGRVSDVVVRAGVPLYPIEVEAVASGLAGVRRCALAGLPDATLGQRAVLAVEAADGAPPGDGLIKGIREACTARGFAIDEVRFIEKIPTDPRHNAKVDQAKLIALLAK